MDKSASNPDLDRDKVLADGFQTDVHAQAGPVGDLDFAVSIGRYFFGDQGLGQRAAFGRILAKPRVFEPGKRLQRGAQRQGRGEGMVDVGEPARRSGR